MSRYIDVEPLEKALKMNANGFKHQGSEFAKGFDAAIATMKGILQGLPTADVVEVLRCKDCAHYHEMKGFDYKGRKAHHCVWHSALRGENDYCSDGIRREKCEIG